MKRPFWRQNDRIVKAPPRPRVVRALTGLFLAAVIAAFVTALGVVDYQSRAVGWNQHHSEFAFSATRDTVQITVLGMHGTFTLQPVYQVMAYARSYQQGMEMWKPAPVWLTQSVGKIAIRAQGWRIQRAWSSLERMADPAERLAIKFIEL